VLPVPAVPHGPLCPPPEPPGNPDHAGLTGVAFTALFPPPVDVIVENIEGDPFVAVVESFGVPAPPAPTVTGVDPTPIVNFVPPGKDVL
jgi:hypothetical protein